MEVTRRTQVERSAATRDALLTAAAKLFAERGYNAVGTPEIAATAGVTRGAMYHQFGDKLALFREVAESTERDVTQRIADDVTAAAPADPLAALHAAIDGYFAACRDPAVRQILLVDAPVVLGWDGFRELAQEYGLGLTEQLLRTAIEARQLPDLPVPAFAHVLIGALQEAALLAASEPQAGDEAARVVHVILDGIAGDLS